MSDRINVIRAPRDGEHAYLAISRALTQDRRLSFEARGVLAYLLSKPSDWIVRVPDLQKEGNCGRDRIYRILKELKEAGYLHRDQEHQANGTFTWGPYRVYEQPFTDKADMVEQQQNAAQPFTEKPYTDKPDTVKPYTENPHTYIIEKSTDQRFLQNRDSTPPPAAPKKQNGVGGDDEIATLLDEYNIGAADGIAKLYREKYPNVDAATIRQCFDNLLADGVPKGAIVNRLRKRPPEPGKPYQRSKAPRSPGERIAPTVGLTRSPPPPADAVPAQEAAKRMLALRDKQRGVYPDDTS